MPLLAVMVSATNLRLLDLESVEKDSTTQLGRATCERFGTAGGVNVSRVQAEVQVVEDGAALRLTSRGTNPTPVWASTTTAGSSHDGGNTSNDDGFTKRLLRRGESVVLRDGDRFGLYTYEEAPGTWIWRRSTSSEPPPAAAGLPAAAGVTAAAAAGGEM